MVVQLILLLNLNTTRTITMKLKRFILVGGIGAALVWGVFQLASSVILDTDQLGLLNLTAIFVWMIVGAPYLIANNLLTSWSSFSEQTIHLTSSGFFLLVYFIILGLVAEAIFRVKLDKNEY